MFKNYNISLNDRDENRVFSQDLWHDVAKYIFNESHATSSLINFNQLHQSFTNLAQDCDDNGVMFSFQAHLWGGIYPINQFGSLQQKDDYLADLVSGKKIGCLAYTDCKDSPVLAKKMANGSLELNGVKKYITNGPIADFITVYIKLDNFKMQTCILKKETKGITVKENIKLAGLKTSPIADIEFNQCIVEPINFISSSDEGLMIFNSCIEKERLFIMSSILGRLTKLKSDYINIANQYKLLSHYPNLETLSFVENSIYTTECLLSNNLQKLARNESIFISSAQAKTIITPLYQEACRKIVQSLGAIGLEQINGFERENRDALASSLYSGSNELLKILIAKCAKN